MGENQKRILQMLAEGKINVDEASRLLSLVDNETTGEKQSSTKGSKANAKYLYVQVEPKPGYESHDNARVNIRVPVSLIRAGMKLKSLIPPQAADEINKGLKQKGIEFDIRNMKDENIEQIVYALQDTEITVESDKADVKIRAE